MIELVVASACIACDKCVNACPTNVFDTGPDGVPVIARQSDCQTCFMCEAYCPTDALYVSPESSPLGTRESLPLELIGSYRERLGWGKVAAIGVATVVGFLAMAGPDWLRPEESRTHLGRFFGSLLAGDAWGILVRKLETNVDLLLGPERAALLVPVVLVAVIWVLARPGSAAGQRVQPLMSAYPGLRVGLIGLVVALTVGFLLNDSQQNGRVDRILLTIVLLIANAFFVGS